MISEYAVHADGSFEIRNDSLAPFAVVLKPMSFSVDSEGSPTFRPLDSDIDLELSSKSFRVLPHRQFTVYYRARAAKLPAWFTIYASVISNARANGMNVVIDLPHTVYLLDEAAFSPASVLVQTAKVDPASRRISAAFENTSTQFERVSEIDVLSNSSKEVYPGFPFFPGQLRVIHLAWTKQDSPRKIELKFKKFKVEHALQSSATEP